MWPGVRLVGGQSGWNTVGKGGYAQVSQWSSTWPVAGKSETGRGGGLVQETLVLAVRLESEHGILKEIPRHKSACNKKPARQFHCTSPTRAEDSHPKPLTPPTPHIPHFTMKYTTICAAFFAAAVAASDVKQLNKDTFKAFVEENDLVLAECKPPTRRGTCFRSH
jgi:hypothetical protein